MEKKLLSRTLFETYSALSYLHETQYAQEPDRTLLGENPDWIKKIKPVFYPANASAINEYLGFPKNFGQTTPRLIELEKKGYVRRIKLKEFSKGINGYRRLDENSEGNPVYSQIVNSTRWYVPIRGKALRVWSEEILNIPYLNDAELKSFEKKILNPKLFEFIVFANKTIEKTDKIIDMMNEDIPQKNYSDYHWINGIETVQNYYLRKEINPESMKRKRITTVEILSDSENPEEYSPAELLLFWLIYSNKHEKVMSSKYSDSDFRIKNQKEIDERARFQLWDSFTRLISKMVQENRTNNEIQKIVKGFELMNTFPKEKMEDLSEKEKSFMKIFSANPRVNYFFEDLLNKKCNTPYRYLENVIYRFNLRVGA